MIRSARFVSAHLLLSLGWLGFSTAPVRAQERAPAASSTDDAIGWAESASAEPAAREATPTDDAVGWGSAETAATSGLHSASASSSPAETSKLHAQGRLRLRGGLWTRRAGPRPSQARTLVDLKASYADNFRVRGLPATLRMMVGGHGEFDAVYYRPGIDAPTRDAYGYVVYLTPSYISLAIGRLSLSSGKQTIPLGQGELLGMLNVLNPRDLREPGLSELDDMRIPVLTSRVGLNLGDFNLECLIVHEASFGLLPPPLGRFSPFAKLISDDPLVGETLGRKTWSLRGVPHGLAVSGWQYLGRLSYDGEGLDLELIAGTVLDATGVPRLPGPAQLAQQEVTLELFRPRHTLLGLSGAWVLGELLLRFELAGELGKPQATRDFDRDLLRLGYVRRDQAGLLLGLTYFGIPGGNLGLEAQKVIVFYPPTRERDGRVLLWPVERLSLGMRYMQNLVGETLQLGLIGMLIGPESFNGAIARAELSYSAGALRVYAAYVKYFAGSEFGPFYGFENNDSVLCTLRWDFIVE